MATEGKETVEGLQGISYRIENDDYKKYDVLHGQKLNRLQNKIRWDDNQLSKDYFGNG